METYRMLSLAYPFAAISYKATITMAMTEGKLLANKARDLLLQLFHGRGCEGVRDNPNLRVYVNIGRVHESKDKGNVEHLADDFEKLAVVEEVTEVHEEQIGSCF